MSSIQGLFYHGGGVTNFPGASIDSNNFHFKLFPIKLHLLRRIFCLFLGLDLSTIPYFKNKKDVSGHNQLEFWSLNLNDEGINITTKNNKRTHKELVEYAYDISIKNRIIKRIKMHTKSIMTKDKKSTYKDVVNWKLFLILLGASIFGILAVLPYTLTLQGGVLQNIPVPLYILLVAQTIQSIVLFTVTIFIGLYLSKKVGLGLPILEGWLEGREVKNYLKSILGISIGLGIVAGILIIGLDYLFSFAGVTINVTQAAINPPAWQGFLASFYGGINEEILLRLFLMTLIVWIIFKIKKTEEGKPTNIGIWLAIILAAVIFGAGHLPAVMTITTLTPLLIARTIVLNAVGGIIFGWLYWKKGLESAMISHFSADIVLHVILPLLAVL